LQTKEVNVFKISAFIVTALCLGATHASADNQSRTFNFVNDSDRTVVHVAASNIARRYYDPIDLLGDEILAPGESTTIEPFNDQGWCRFDIRVTFRNGSSQEIGDVNLCEATEVTTYGRVNHGYYHSVSY
jgi:hypothetical protein